MMEVFLAITQLLLLGAVLLFIYRHDQREQEKFSKEQQDFKEFTGRVVEHLSNNSNVFAKSISDNQREFMKQIQTHSTKSLASVEKLSTKILELSTKKETVVTAPKPDYFNHPATSVASPLSVNDIEALEEPEEQLADIPRIPIVDGVRLKFEGEDSFSNPIDITPVGSITPNLMEETNYGARAV